jgi:hypothetical protein
VPNNHTTRVRRFDVFAIAHCCCPLRLFLAGKKPEKVPPPPAPVSRPLTALFISTPFLPYKTVQHLSHPVDKFSPSDLSACASSASHWWHIPVFRLHRHPLEFHGLFSPAASLACEPRPEHRRAEPRACREQNTTQNPASPPTVATRLSRRPPPRTRGIDGARRDQEPPSGPEQAQDVGHRPQGGPGAVVHQGVLHWFVALILAVHTPGRGNKY